MTPAILLECKVVIGPDLDIKSSTKIMKKGSKKFYMTAKWDLYDKKKNNFFFYYMNKNQNSFGLNQDSRKANKIGKKKVQNYLQNGTM